jgi:CRP-like cAMP-binding protein
MNDQTRNIYKAGSYIYIEGDDDSDSVFIVEKGLVEFQSSTNRVRSHGSIAGTGDVFGSISCLSKRPRMETAFAKVNTAVIIFNRKKFLSVLQKNSDIAIKLLNSFADELRQYDTMIFPIDINQNASLPEDIHLFRLGRYYYEENMPANAGYVLSRYLELYPGGSNLKEAEMLLADIWQKGFKKDSKPVRNGIYLQYADRQIIFCEHEPGRELFIIKKGKVKIIKHQDRNEIILSVLSEGEIFGELAIVSDLPRNATAISFGGTVLLPINKNSLMKLIQKSSDILKRIFTAISQRVWFTFIRMESKFFEKPITRIYVFLENKLIEDNNSHKRQDQRIFNFGIDELIRMTNIPADKIPSVMDELTKDRNLEFNVGQILIENPSLVSSKAQYYRSRDRLFEGGEKQDKNQKVAYKSADPAADQSNDIDQFKELKPESDQTLTRHSASLYEELENEVK